MTEIKNLLARALAYIEDSKSLTEREKLELIEDLHCKIQDLEES